MKKIKRLITVTGSRTNTLWHMLNHYKDIVDEMCVVVYEWDGLSTYSDVQKIVLQFPNAKIIRRETKEKFNWEYVTKLYNDAKKLYPNDWWIVSDDDEFHIYSKQLDELIEDCEENGWDVIRGGFIDRLGDDGVFPTIKADEDIFKQFPLAGFFRYPMSGACPNKICVMKGYVELTSGQHYAIINGEDTWRWKGWSHPLIAPYQTHNVQVHHFKWDSTCVERIKAVADIKEKYAYSDEYLKMYNALRKTNFEVDILNKEYMIDNIGVWDDYQHWDKLLKKIISI